MEGGSAVSEVDSLYTVDEFEVNLNDGKVTLLLSGKNQKLTVFTRDDRMVSLGAAAMSAKIPLDYVIVNFSTGELLRAKINTSEWQLKSQKSKNSS